MTGRARARRQPRFFALIVVGALALALGTTSCVRTAAPKNGTPDAGAPGESHGALGAAGSVGTATESGAPGAVRTVPLRPFPTDVQLLDGHPDSVGRPFVMRIRELPGTVIPPHRHPVDEHLTVLEGTFHLGTGERFDSASLRPLGPGSYAFLPAGTMMFGQLPDGGIVQVHGMGPFHIHWRDGLRVLSESAAASHPFQFRIGDVVLGTRGPGRIREGYASGALVQYVVERADGGASMEHQAELRRP